MYVGMKKVHDIMGEFQYSLWMWGTLFHNSQIRKVRKLSFDDSPIEEFFLDPIQLLLIGLARDIDTLHFSKIIFSFSFFSEIKKCIKVLEKTYEDFKLQDIQNPILYKYQSLILYNIILLLPYELSWDVFSGLP